MACYRNLCIFIFLSMMPFAAHAQSGGLQKVTGVLDNILMALNAVAVVTVTIAIIWVGYKILFNGQSIRDCMPIIFGAILIAGAAEIARFLIQ